ncbi:MAG TPA: ATPase, T2SS/T4P/T4SS family [Noviherbaspirillum sp.]|nr:ATPase, T2SS/T4P/T4SS family [Noviherbaspirillum sp.]
MLLNDLVFSDLFVAEDAATSWFKATPDSLTVNSIPAECGPELIAMRKLLDERKGPPSFRIDWPAVGGLRLRVERISISESKVMYVCRRYRLVVNTLAALGMPANVADKLMVPQLRDGLVVFLGKAGAGKTTTAGSFIIERLSRHGGVCWTIENPIELPLQGKHGRGWCYQTEASNDAQIGPAVRPLMRATPNIIFIGELRDGLAVREAIKAATSGHLVVATFHSSDLLSGLARLARFAGDEFGGDAIAESLRVAIHLSLHNAEPGAKLPGSGITLPEAKGTGTPPRVLSVEPLWISGEVGDAVRSIVRDGDFHLLKSEVERQRRSFLMGRLP